jgi:hypothetical protein
LMDASAFGRDVRPPVKPRPEWAESSKYSIL